MLSIGRNTMTTGANLLKGLRLHRHHLAATCILCTMVRKFITGLGKQYIKREAQ